ncbi:MAG: membrane protein insertase YidC [Saezia sp.]
MTDNIRNAIVWFIFIFSSLMLVDQWRVYNGQPPLFGYAENPQSQQTQNTPQNPEGIDVPNSPTAVDASSVPEQSGTRKGDTFVITTDLYQATFDAVGGKLIQLDLMKHYAEQNAEEVPIKLVDPAYHYEVRTGLINVRGGLLPNHNTPMHFKSSQTTLQDGQEQLDVRFESDPVNGVQLNKTYRFTRNNYVIEVISEIVNVSNEAVTPEVYYQLVRNSEELPGASRWFGGATFTGPAYYTDKGYNKVAFSDIDKKALDLNNVTDGWIAMVQHYFVSAWLLEDGVQRRYFTKKLDGGDYAIGMISASKMLQPGEHSTQTARLYAGPQNEKVLENMAPGLELVKDYGIFRMFSKPLFWLMYFFNGFLHNWGWSIVALVVAIKAAFFWLNAKAYKSMAKMRALSPRLQEINERHKDDPRKKQEETMRIYKEEKINPLGGCLPILIQIPVFIALYWVLLSSVEMRHAPWIGWITDLSAKDPYYILPAIMGASTMLQTWLNPKPADPMQARMMWMMPLMFSVMFFFFPAGLVLYWVTNNILSIAQQWFINKKIIPKS